MGVGARRAPSSAGEAVVERLEDRRLLAAAAFDVLVFSKTVAFRHDSIPAATEAIRNLGAANNFTVTATEDAGAFTDANLARYEAVVFLMTTGDVLDANQQAAFERFIAAGHGYVGVHSAADTEYGWAWYGGLVGAYFRNHPSIQQATVDVADTTFPATAGLPQRWTRTDEWYNFATNPRDGVHVLMTLDEKSYSGGGMGADHPIAWWHDYSGGRAFYTGIGHTAATYSDPLALGHLLGGIRWAAGVASPDHPDVAQAFVAGAGWTAGFKQHLADRGAGSAQYGYGVGPGATPGELPWTNLNRVSVTFDRPASVTASSLSVRGVNVGTYPVDGFAYDPETRTATWTLARGPAHDTLQLDLDLGAGGHYRQRLDVLPGDVNRDGAVNAVDMGQTRARQLTGTTRPGTAPNTYDAYHDVNGSGTIDATDLGAVRASQLRTLPRPEPGPGTLVVLKLPPRQFPDLLAVEWTPFLTAV